MAVETNDGYGNGEIIEHEKPERPNLCPKCKTTDMIPRFYAKGTDVPWKRQIENVSQFMRGDDYYFSDSVKTEHIVWTCPVCQYKIAKPCG